MTDEKKMTPATGDHRNRTALVKSILCLYLPFVWLLPASLQLVNGPRALLAFVWFPGLAPGWAWIRNDWNYLHSMAITAVLLVVIFLLIRCGGRIAKLTMIVTVVMALLMSVLVRYRLML